MDVNIQGQGRILSHVLSSETWQGIWGELGLRVWTCTELGLAANTPDDVIWHFCQQRQMALLTGNRNHDGPDSLEATIRAHNTPRSLPVFTLADAEQVKRSRAYADRVVEKLLEYLIDLDDYRGGGRFYLP